MAAEHPDHTVFHTAAWARVLASTYGHRPIYLRATSGETTQMLLPLMEVRSWLTGRRGVSLPFSDRCGPLIFGEFEPSHVVETLSRMAQERGWKHFEVRGGPELRSTVDRKPSYYSHVLNLRRTEEEVFDGFDAAARRAVRKAQRSGLKVRVERDLAAIEKYYGLHVRTRRKHGVPPQPRLFFKHIHREIIQPGQGFVVLAEKEGRPIAAAVFFLVGQHAVYKFGASDESQQECRGSNLVMWEGIRVLMRSGAHLLDFGRTSTSNEGLRRFKLSWGTAENPQYDFRRVTRHGTWVTGTDRAEGAHQKIFRRMPGWANRMIGTLLYRHLD
jgi:hypothetical protein